MSRISRDAVLDSSEVYSFARPLVNSGRLSVPCTYDGSPLNTPTISTADPAAPGPALLPRCAASTASCSTSSAGLHAADLQCRCGRRNRGGRRGRETARPDDAGRPDRRACRALPRRRAVAAVYLIRPDQHVAARFPEYNEAQVRFAIRRATGKE
ncbi:MAG: hypothetical protein R3D59_04235 [Paracoccaceae bacterium]